jgi:glutaredoxin
MSSYTELIKNNSEGIFIISKNDCSLCEKLKGLFDTIEVKYKTYLYQQENEINDTLPFKEQMKKETNGKMFPFCYFNGKYVGGYKEIHQNLLTGKLQEQLNDIGIEYEDDF